jgi:hypothetical protein
LWLIQIEMHGWSQGQARLKSVIDSKVRSGQKFIIASKFEAESLWGYYK